MTYILCRSSTRPTARALASDLGIPTRKQVSSIAPLIRWGNSENSFAVDSMYNAPTHIQLASNKVMLHNLLATAQVPHVEFYRTAPESYPVVVRTTITGSGGVGIVVCRTEAEYNQYRGCWWSPWKTFEFEIGVHILGGSVVRVFKKVQQEGAVAEEFPIRNMTRGYSYSLRTPSTYGRALPEFVTRVYGAFPIKMARLDLGFERGKGYCLIEANSAPGLAENDNTLGLYIAYLKEELKL